MAGNVLTVGNPVGTILEVPTNGDGPVLASVDAAPAPPTPLATSNPVAVSAAVAQVGSATDAARGDHRHHVEVGVPVDVGLTNAGGSAVELSRRDHVHAFVASLIASAYAAAWAVADWYIDGTTGNDANNGTTSGTPLRTGAELARRLGPYALWGQSVTVHVLANGMTDGLVLRGAMLVAGTHLDVVGTATTLVSDTIGTYAALTHGVYPGTPATATRITGTAILDFTAYAFTRVRNTTAGARLNTLTWISKPNPGGVGVATTEVSPPALLDTAFTGTNTVFASTFAPGDTFVIESLPAVPALSIDLDGPILHTAGSQYDRRQYAIRDLSVDTLQVKASASAVNLKSLIYGCVLDNHLVLEQQTSISSAMTMVSASWITAKDPQSVTKRVVGPGYQFCLFGGGLPSITSYIFHTPTIVVTSCLMQATAMQFLFGITLSGFQIFDVPGAGTAALFFVNGFHQLSNVSGARNAGIGVQAQNSTTMAIGLVLNVQATTSDAKWFTAPATLLTITQFRQPDDYAQRGITPAMVAGATTVTVPYYDNTTQQVTVSHAAFAGTPGILSVQQISTTQFTVTSSSALDTSTVRWQISPLGRNIFVSSV